jgi:RNA polymerase sigma-70 factor (ECF subfamily)
MSARRVVAIAAPRGRHADEARPDAELVADIAAGDLAALGVVYDRHGEDVRRFLVRAGAGADADDVLHETFLALTSAAPTYDGRASAKPLLLGIAARLLRGRRRTLARWARAATAWVSAGPTESTRTPEDDASTTEEVAAFERALSRLSEEKRVVFLLSDSAFALHAASGGRRRRTCPARTSPRRSGSRSPRSGRGCTTPARRCARSSRR